MMKLNKRSSSAIDLAGDTARRMAISKPLPLRPQDAQTMQAMTEFRFGPDESRFGWSLGTGPLVVFVHGYSGRGAQMAVLASHIAEAGFQAVIFDAGGHGSSRAEPIGFNTFIHATRDIVAHLDGPVHALIGHSAGGLGMMRARGLYGVTAEKYVVISSPFFPYPPLENMRKKGASEEAIDHLKPVIAAQFQTDWSTLANGLCYAPESEKPLLAIFDRADEMVWHTDAEPLQSIWPNTSIVMTDGYGHNRILKADETLAAISDFLA